MSSLYALRDSDFVDTAHPCDLIEPEPEPVEPYRDELAAALKSVLGWVGAARTARGRKARHLLLLEAVHAERRSMAQIAKECGLSRSAVSQAAAQLEAKFGIRIARK